jgi:hypothetical protein
MSDLVERINVMSDLVERINVMSDLVERINVTGRGAIVWMGPR